MNELLDTTFITVLKIESEDRLRNVKTVLGFLNHHFKTNVLIYEMCKNGSHLDFLDQLANLNIEVIKDDYSRTFHRTKFLNELLMKVKTQVTCNYDIDVVLPIEIYKRCEQEMIAKKSLIIYPYPIGNAQWQIHQNLDRTEFEENFDLEVLNSEPKKNIFSTYAGHAIFMDTQVYKDCGGENENFISYGPEDRERILRFYKLEADVSRIETGLVYHFEHGRGKDSGDLNPFFENNNREFETIKQLNKEQIKIRVPKIV